MVIVITDWHTVFALLCVTPLISRCSLTAASFSTGSNWPRFEVLVAVLLKSLVGRDAVVGRVDFDVAKDRNAYFLFKVTQGRMQLFNYLVLKMEALGCFETSGSLFQRHSVAAQKI